MQGGARHLPGANSWPQLAARPLPSSRRDSCSLVSGSRSRMILAPSCRALCLPIPVGELEPSLSLTHLRWLCWI